MVEFQFNFEATEPDKVTRNGSEEVIHVTETESKIGNDPNITNTQSASTEPLLGCAILFSLIAFILVLIEFVAKL